VLLFESACVQAGAATADLGAADQRLDHAVEVVVAVGQLLAGDRARDGVAQEEHAQLYFGSFGECAGEA
jgi:hypothetical protein